MPCGQCFLSFLNSEVLCFLAFLDSGPFRMISVIFQGTFWEHVSWLFASQRPFKLFHNLHCHYYMSGTCQICLCYMRNSLKWIEGNKFYCHSPTKYETIVTRPGAQQQHRVSWVVVVVGLGGPRHYVVTPTRVEVEMRLSWAVTINIPLYISFLPLHYVHLF